MALEVTVMASYGRKCAACGSVELMSGSAFSYGGYYGVGFKAQGRFGHPVGTVAYACLTCGHLGWSVTAQGLADLREARTVENAGEVAEELRTMAESDDMLREVRSRVSDGGGSLDDRDR